MIDTKLTPPTDEQKLCQFNIDFIQRLIEHEQSKISFATIKLNYGNPPPSVITEAKKIIENARAKIGRLDFELRALQLKLRVMSNDRH